MTNPFRRFGLVLSLTGTVYLLTSAPPTVAAAEACPGSDSPDCCKIPDDEPKGWNCSGVTIEYCGAAQGSPGTCLENCTFTGCFPEP